MAIGFVQFPLWFIWSSARHRDGSVWNVSLALNNIIMLRMNNFLNCFLQSMKKASTPSDEWGPSDPLIRKQWLLYKHQMKEQRKARCSEEKYSQFSQKLRNVFC